MTLSLRSATSITLVAFLGACADATRPLAPTTAPSLGVAAAPSVMRISEIHYDNAGTDVGEAIEVAGPAGTDLTGWKVVLYNGTGGAVYDTKSLSGAMPKTCGTDGVVVVNYPSNGIQNGSPDGMALVNPAGVAVEFLSYEGTFTAVGGAANGKVSVDIGATEAGTEAIGQSLQRNGLGGWTKAASTFGACNDQPPPPYAGPTTVVIDELMGEPLAALSQSWGEWFEVYNYGTEPVDLSGWKIRSGGDTEHTISAAVVVAPGAYVVLGRSNDRTKNGDALVSYNYFSGNTTTIWMDANDWLALRTPTSVTVDSVAWTSLPTGASKALRDPTKADANVDGAGWGFSTTTFGSGDFGTPGSANTGVADAAPAVPTGVARITFSGRDGTNPPLPVGFEDQLFASAFDVNKVSVGTTFTWSSATPELASVDQDGVVHALGAGTAIIRATSADGRVALYGVPTREPVASLTARYGNNVEFGVPTDADASDDILVTRPEYTISYSPLRNTPNWVSYEIEATHFGAEDRCDCFTPDPALPSSVARVTTADYTGAGAAAGFGIDRGHLARSADRTSASLDNAYTFYLSNIIPQAADLNQGPWAILENYLGDFARDGAHEVYVVTGVAGNTGTLKNEGKVVIPGSVWKVAVIMPRDRGLSDVTSAADFQLVAVDMPNVAGVRNVDWRTYQTTVDAIEAKTGYDLLSLLPDEVEWLVEAGFTSPKDVPADRLLGILTSGVQGLTAASTLSDGEGNSLLAKLATVQAQMDADNNGARGALNAFRNEVQAMVRSGRLSEDEGRALATFAGWVGDAMK